MWIGYTHQLNVVRSDTDTIWLDGGSHGEIALATAGMHKTALQAVTHMNPVQVFIHTNKHGQALVTTQLPKVQLGECASLRVIKTSQSGAFLDWGIEKDLLLPFAEQRRPVAEGDQECVLVYLDNTGRLAASSRLDHHLEDTLDIVTAWQPVSLLVYQRTDLGFKAVVDNKAIGLLYKDEIFQTVHVGDQLDGFVKRKRQDGRLDLALQPPGSRQHAALTERIMQHLISQGGSSNLTDKSPPETIYATFQVSKKNFKKAIGTLYRQRRIRLEADKILLVDSDQ